jgi:hypothetical protein
MRGAIRLHPSAERLPAMILQLLKDATRERHLALERRMPLLDEYLGDILAGANATYATLSAWMRVAGGDAAPHTRARSAAQPVLA